MTSTAWRAQPTLIKDAKHKPKTHGSFGILVVGLGGSNGTCLLAGILANRLGIEWKGPKGERMTTPNYNGCITQLNGSQSQNNPSGFRDLVNGKLANASMAAIGGWDIQDTKPGDALLEKQVLDYDLVQQVQDEMNRIKIFRGLYDPRFTMTNKQQQQSPNNNHNHATYILTEQEAKNDAEALKCLRADIRYFKWRNGVVGHTTVIWSAGTEPNSSFVSQLQTANELLDSFELTEQQRGGYALPPSLLYATAALLEGCSFVNAGNQNTLDCPGLAQLAQRQLGVYCLGSNFYKSSSLRFQTVTMEYLQTIGMIQSLSKKEDDDDNYQQRGHDGFREYTSIGFLGQTHTMTTYTSSCSDSSSSTILCVVPSMIDVAVWCDFFSQRSWSYDNVSKALSYLFQTPEGVVGGSSNNRSQIDTIKPGFFQQMNELKSQVMAAHESSNGTSKVSTKSYSTTNKAMQSINNQNGTAATNTANSTRRVRIREEGQLAATTEWAIPDDAGIICVGLACLDRQLNSATGGNREEDDEGIETFQGEICIGGGRYVDG